MSPQRARSARLEEQRALRMPQFLTSTAASASTSFASEAVDARTGALQMASETGAVCLPACLL
jgi:hypothetical protein